MEDFRLIESVERLGSAEIALRKHTTTPICANVDLYSGLVYDMLGIPRELFTPLFATARIAGWCAHRIEEAATCHRIMRPAYHATAKKWHMCQSMSADYFLSVDKSRPSGRLL